MQLKGKTLLIAFALASPEGVSPKALLSIRLWPPGISLQRKATFPMDDIPEDAKQQPSVSWRWIVTWALIVLFASNQHIFK